MAPVFPTFNPKPPIPAAASNVGKTEAMGCRIKKAVFSEEVENAMKERASVKVDGVVMWGWIVPAT